MKNPPSLGDFLFRIRPSKIYLDGFVIFNSTLIVLDCSSEN